MGWTFAPVAGVAVLVAAAGSAHATYSIVAGDPSTGRVGGATTSCVGSFSVSVVYDSAPGHGAVHAQAWFNVEGRDLAAARLAMDVPPADIIAEITHPTFDGNAASRQYGIVDLSGRAAGWTGASCLAHAEDRQGETDRYTYSLQGNILTSAAVLDQAESAFQAGGCDLADSLMLALEAGADNGEGDSRCTPGGIPSDAAFLTVEEADGTAVLRLDVTDTAPTSAVTELRALYDAWRETNPCPAPPPPDAGAVSEDGGVPVDGDEGDADGCACQTARADSSRLPAIAALVLLALPLLKRRRGGSAWESNPPCRRSHGAPSVLKTEPGTSPRRTSAGDSTKLSRRCNGTRRHEVQSPKSKVRTPRERSERRS